MTVSDVDVDVVVVGARCAGAAVAALAAARGLRTVVLDKGDVHDDVPSTHVIHASGVRLLARFGALDAVLASDAPPLRAAEMFMEDLRIVCPFSLQKIGSPGLLSVRRTVLDPILLANAAERGADVRPRSRVTSVSPSDRPAVEGHGTGARMSVEIEPMSGRRYRLRARLVVGADGRTSTVARHVGARSYLRRPSRRAFGWWYLADPHPDRRDVVQIHRNGDRFVLAAPTNDGVLQIISCLPGAEFGMLRRDPDAWLRSELLAAPGLAERVAGAPLVERPCVSPPVMTFFRRAAGPGWVLVGDAGRVIDPTCGHGITDAFEHADLLDRTVLAALTQGTSGEVAARHFWRRRDASERPFLAFWKWLARAEALSTVELAYFDEVARDPKLRPELAEASEKLRRPAALLHPALAARLVRRSVGPGARSRASLDQLLLGGARLVGEDVAHRVRLRVGASIAAYGTGPGPPVEAAGCRSDRRSRSSRPSQETRPPV